jgi:hypothetical protein
VLVVDCGLFDGIVVGTDAGKRFVDAPEVRRISRSVTLGVTAGDVKSPGADGPRVYGLPEARHDRVHATEADRDEAIDSLKRAYVRDELTTEELGERVSIAHRQGPASHRASRRPRRPTKRRITEGRPSRARAKRRLASTARESLRLRGTRVTSSGASVESGPGCALRGPGVGALVLTPLAATASRSAVALARRRRVFAPSAALSSSFSRDALTGRPPYARALYRS